MGIGTAGGIGGIAAAGGIGGIAAAGIGAAGAGAAASTQASASENAQQLQAQEAQNALNFQEQEWNTNQLNEQPFLQAGQQMIGSISQELNQSFQPQAPLAPGSTQQFNTADPFAPWTQQFNAPTAAEAQATPGYQFELGQGEQALQNSAAASGGLLTSGTAKGMTNYAEGLASTNYQQAYQNALTQYQTAYNTFQNNQANLFNRQAAVAGIGQTTAGQLGQQGQAASGNVANISLGTGAQQGQSLQNAGAATASGYTGIANALGGGVQNVSSALTLQQLLAGQGAGGYVAPGSLPLAPDGTVQSSVYG